MKKPNTFGQAIRKMRIYGNQAPLGPGLGGLLLRSPAWRTAQAIDEAFVRPEPTMGPLYAALVSPDSNFP